MVSEPNGPGILCPKCGSSMMTTDSRKRVNHVYRRKGCLSSTCDGKTTTREYADVHLSELLKKTWKEVASLAASKIAVIEEKYESEREN